MTSPGRRWANQFAARVHERAAGVAGIDRGVGLDEILVLRDADVLAADGRHDPERHGFVELKRVADRQHPLGDDLAARTGCPPLLAPNARQAVLQIPRIQPNPQEINPKSDKD